MFRKSIYGLKYGVIWLNKHKARSTLISIIFMLSSMLLIASSTINNLAENNVKSVSHEVSIAALLAPDLKEDKAKEIKNKYQQDSRVSKVVYTDKAGTKRMLTENDQNIYSMVSDKDISSSIRIYARNKHDLTDIENELSHDKDVLNTSDTSKQMTIYKALSNIQKTFKNVTIGTIAVIALITVVITFINNASMQESIRSMKIQGADLGYTYGPLVSANLLTLLIGTVLSSGFATYLKNSQFTSFLTNHGMKSVTDEQSFESIVISFLISVIVVLVASVITVFVNELQLNRKKSKS